MRILHRDEDGNLIVLMQTQEWRSATASNDENWPVMRRGTPFFSGFAAGFAAMESMESASRGSWFFAVTCGVVSILLIVMQARRAA